MGSFSVPLIVMEILSVSKSWKKLWFSADQNICCFKMKVAEEFIFSVFLCRTVYLILSSKVFCRQIQNVFQRSHVTVFLEHCISLKGKHFNTKLFVVPYENAWIFSENRNWKKSIFDLSYSVRKKVTELIHISSVLCYMTAYLLLNLPQGFSHVVAPKVEWYIWFLEELEEMLLWLLGITYIETTF